MTQCNNISRRECEITQAVGMAQMLMLDLAARKHGITRKVLHLETGIPLTTLKSYEEGTAMPVAALVKMARIIPNELTSLMLEPGGKLLADDEPAETDIDALAVAAVNLLQKYVQARHPDSPGGVRIVHSETDDIKISAAALGDRASKVASA